jgi:hypothetical protein
LSKDKFESVAEQKFTTQLSNGKEVELKKDGRTIDVSYELREEFFKLSIDNRLHEADAQIRAMRKGLNQIVPANYLGLFSWYSIPQPSTACLALNDELTGYLLRDVCDL